MSAYEYYGSSNHYQRPHRDLNAPLPPIPSYENTEKSKESSHVVISQISPSPFDEEASPLRKDGRGLHYRKPSGNDRDPFTDESAIPLHTQYPKTEHEGFYGTPYQQPGYSHYAPGSSHEKRTRRRKKTPFFSRRTPWFIYFMTLVQLTVFIVEIVKNSILTGSPIETHPSFNPMIGPSPYVLINMGARFVPCMRNQEGVQNSNLTVEWPCPGQTTEFPHCTLAELCGFSGVPNPHVGGSLDQQPAPNQWFRFIVPIFLHAGLVHIGFNMLLQILMGGDMEKAIGPLRIALVYFSSGIFGFVLGGNFAPSGIASTGASGSLFGIIALTLLDLLYTWQQRRKPVRDLIFILLDIIISFVLGLLPGLDNFSHIGGFLMGIVLGICLLRSPTALRKRTGSLDSNSSNSRGRSNRESGSSRVYHVHPHDDGRHRRGTSDGSDSSRGKKFLSRPSSSSFFQNPVAFFRNRKSFWWAWWLIRAGALVGVIAAFVALIHAFYQYHDTECGWCKYLSCLPVNNWCDVGSLTFTQNNGTSSVRRLVF